MYFPAELEKSSVKLGEAYYLMKDRIKEHAQEILEKARKDLSANNIPFAEKTVWGEPASKIIQEAEQGKYDLLVIGSRGLGEIRSWLLGSVSQRVVRHCKCPVFLIR
jgi:nucleotide-binding universal stress UspA family protein